MLASVVWKECRSVIFPELVNKVLPSDKFDVHIWTLSANSTRYDPQKLWEPNYANHLRKYVKAIE